MKKTLLSILCLLGLFSVGFAYSTEEKQAYNYAYQNRITTKSPISQANMGGNLTRIQMAKMLSNYAINTLGLTPDTSKDCYFSDVSSELDYKYDNGVTKACQLGLMMGVGIDQFNPNDYVTRAQFGTVLSRALNAKYTSRLNRMNNAVPYYSEHLAYLREEGIMNNTSNPSSTLELRGRVMLMLMRADKNYVPEIIPTTHTYSVNKIDTTVRGIATVGCNWLTETKSPYGYDMSMPNKNWTDDAKFVNKALQDVWDNGQHLVQNYIDEANKILDSAGLTTRNQCRYSLLIDELEAQKGYLKSYKTENGKTTVGVDFLSYKESISWDDMTPYGGRDLLKNTSTKLRYYTLSDNVELELLDVDENGYTNEVGDRHDRKYVSNWNVRINAFCNYEPVYNGETRQREYGAEEEMYNRNDFGRLCTKTLIGIDEYINFRFDSAGTIDRISGLIYWLTNAG